ncbi:MAG: phytoene desaturase family protein [Hyphomicrobiales bacterium]
MGETPVVIVGAGIGGLVAALTLAARGVSVRVFEKAAVPGGKMRTVAPGGRPIDAGPTVLTMKAVFEDIFAAAGASFDALVPTRPAAVLARHWWGTDGPLDLYADRERSAAAIGAFAGARAADDYRRFCAETKSVFETLDRSFIRAERPTPVSLVTGAGLKGLAGLWRIRPFETYWQALQRFFQDARLRQLFGRYATYCGSSPFECPATLMLVAHVEQAGVWYVEGGMVRLAEALAALARKAGADIRCNAGVAEIVTDGGRACGVVLDTGERVAARAVIHNGDEAAIRTRRLGAGVANAIPTEAANRSLSAVTFCLEAETAGVDLSRHGVFFSADYKREFDEILGERRLPSDPTVYVCAQDRLDGAPPSTGRERLLLLVNAPADGDTRPPSQGDLDRCLETTIAKLASSGLTLTSATTPVTTGPREFAAMFPATGGALYGRASHGWKASFARPASRTAIPGLYLAGGSVHPGPGVPMAALSGLNAASNAIADLGSTSRWSRAATSGGTSTG